MTDLSRREQEALEDFYEHFMAEMEDMPPEFQLIVEENIWNMI